MLRLPPLLFLLPMAACLPKLDPVDSSPSTEGDTDTDADADTDTDSDADADSDTDTRVVLVDEDGVLPDSSSSAEHADFDFDLSSDQLNNWLHIEIESKTATELWGVLYAPSESCVLVVPGWGWAMSEHGNEGWIKVETRGRHTLSVFGTTPKGGAEVHTTITIVAVSELPFGDADEVCVMGEVNCECTDACNCDEIHG